MTIRDILRINQQTDQTFRSLNDKLDWYPGCY